MIVAEASEPPPMTEPGTDYFANHARARQFPWTLYHQPLERDLARFLRQVAAEHPAGEVLVVGCGLLHEIDAAPRGLRVPRRRHRRARRRRRCSRGAMSRIAGGTVVRARGADRQSLGAVHRFAAIYAKEVVEHVLAWPAWLAGLRRALVPGGRLWLSTPNYGEPWLPALESTVLELIARRSGFSRRDIHPTRFSRGALARGLRAAGFEHVEVKPTPTRLALTSWARAPRSTGTR